MAVELTVEQVIYRAKLVAAFLASEAWTELEERVERRAFQQFKSPEATPEQLQMIWQRLMGFEDLKRELRVLRDRATLDTTEE